ncbi:MAG: adenylate/guanylate cyclase domain-containing protein [SAR324 cluster bacterium]|nr:adenylate/guanylate cyclase domain-containing protein [SAR324 cluster bacterium]
MKKWKVSYKVTILQIMFVLLFITQASMMALFYFGSTNIIFDLSEKITKELTAKIIERSTNFINSPALQTKPVSQLVKSHKIMENHEEMWKIMWEQLMVFPQIQSIFLADAQGSYVQVRREPDYATRYIDRSGETPSEMWFFRDENYNLLKTESNVPDFDPRTRPWYKNTHNDLKIYWTDVYVFTTAKTPGFSATYPVLDENGNVAVVVCINIPLQSLSDFLSEQKVGKNGLVFIVNEKDQIMAYPDSSNTVTTDEKTGKMRLSTVSDLHKNWISDAYHTFKEHGVTKFKSTTQGKNYITNVVPFPKSFTSKWQIFVILPEDDLLGSVNELLIQALFIALVIFAFSFMAVYFMANVITRPIRKLSTATTQIKHLELDNIDLEESAIREIDEMNNALSSTAQGLQSFAKYVPRALVRELIQLGKEAQLGGDQETLTIFFSDIAGFTNISEGMDPQALVFHLSEYLEQLSNIIMEEQGTIDKYIGDAIMAFWGAPMKQENAPYLACRAALRCQKRLTELKEKWRKENKPFLETRIGLHTGLAIVGNFGSQDRMNYTIIGDSVNLASRLEGINKHYGTHIVISEDTWRQVSAQFHCRLLDIVAVKGKTAGVKIYELIAEKSSELPAQILESNQLFEQALQSYLNKDWDSAINLFTKAQEKNPEDHAVQLFLNRSQDFREHPEKLPENWDGTMIYTQK